MSPPTNQTNQKTEAELHNDMVVKHLNDLEGIKQAVIDQQHYEAAEVITKSISLIKSTHILNDFLTKENAVYRSGTRMHLAAAAMNALIGVNMDSCTKTISEKAFAVADAMIEQSKPK